jgi:hypothetical protein
MPRFRFKARILGRQDCEDEAMADAVSLSIARLFHSEGKA